MGFCSSCGTAVEEGARSCPNCGTPINPYSGTNNQNTATAVQSLHNEMNVVNAFKRVVFENYANFNGRASKAEYWWYVLASILVGFITGFMDGFFGLNIFNPLVSLALLIPGLAVSARRLHDTNRSGWWMLIAFTVIGLIPLLIWYIQASDQTENRFGSVPSV